MHTRFIRGVNVIVALSLVAAGCGVTGLAPVSGVAGICQAAAAAFLVQVILGGSTAPPGGDFSGAPAAGVAVTLQPSGGSAETRTTDSNGCAAFTSSPGGIYDVSAAPPAALEAAAQTIRDLNVGVTTRSIVLILSHRLPANAVPPRSPAVPFTGTITGTLIRADGAPQAGDNAGTHAPGELGIVSFRGGFVAGCVCADITDGTGSFTITHPLSNDRPAVTGSLFGGNWDGVTPGGVFGVTTEHLTQFAYNTTAHLVGPSLAFGNLNMQLVTGSQVTSLDAQGNAFLAAFNSGAIAGLSITDVSLADSIGGGPLWLATVYHDTGVTSVTTPFPQIPAGSQSVYRTGVGFAGPFNTGTGSFTAFGLTLTVLVTGAPALNISYLPRPGNPVVGSGSAPTITWGASSGATFYGVNLFDGAGNLVWEAATSTSLSATLPMNLAAGSYSVEVFADDLFTAADFIGGKPGTVRNRAPARTFGSVLRPKDRRIEGTGRNRAQITRRLDALSRVREDMLRRPLLDQTGLSNNDWRTSFSDLISFTR